MPAQGDQARLDPAGGAPHGSRQAGKGAMRRAVLIGGMLALAALVVPGRSQALTARRIAVRHLGTGARFSGTWHDGTRPDPQALAALSAVLADPGCPPRAFDPATIALAWEAGLRARIGELPIHSGYRTPTANRAVDGAGDSFHLRAAALDIGAPQGRFPALTQEAVRLGRGGVGLYPARGFVHLDSGPVRHWGGGAGAAPPSRLTPRGEQMRRGAREWIRRPGTAPHG